jgi:hypothetical protein
MLDVFLASDDPRTSWSFQMPPWAKKHIQEHPRKYSSVTQVWVALKVEF